MHFEKFEAWAVGVEVAEVDSIAMSEARAIKELSVVVESCRTPDDFVASIAVNISNGEVVVAIAIHGAASACATCWSTRSKGTGAACASGEFVAGWAIRCMEPLLSEFLTIEIHSPNVSESVVATREDTTWTLVRTIEISHGC